MTKSSPRSLLSERFPELYAQLAFERNARDFPIFDCTKITPSFQGLIWWECSQYGHQWLTTPRRRVYRGQGCPICVGTETLPGWNCLKSTFPEMFEQLHFAKNMEAGINVVYLAPKAPTKVWWQCQVDPDHVWQAQISARTGKGKSGCPKCRTFKTESEFRNLFDQSTNIAFDSGHIIAPRKLFKSPKVQIDIVNHEHKIAIEYDGRFTHGGNHLYKTTLENCLARDIDSTLAILNAGYTLIRIRNTPLIELDLTHPNLKQLPHKDHTDKMPTIEATITYLQSLGKSIHLTER